MARIKTRIIQEDEVYANVHVNLDDRGSQGYEASVELFNKDGEGWVAHIKFDDMPPQKSFEDAVDRLGLYLKKMAPALKGKNFKHINPEPLFNPKHFK
jgi:hypothetical protein